VSRAAKAAADKPDDVGAAARLCLAIDALGNKSLQAKAYETLAAAAREDGQFALAAWAAAGLERLGDGKGAKAQRAALAAAYGKGSARVDPARRPKPPAPPRKDTAAGGEAGAAGGKGAAGHDAQAAMKAASDALGKVAAVAAERGKKAEPLPAVPLVNAIEPADLEKLLTVMKAESRKAGDVVVAAGAAADALYLVARGGLVVSRDGDELSRLGGGAFFGEIALLSGTRRTATVTCVEDVWLLAVPKAALETAAAKAPALADVLARYARARLLATTMRTSEVFKRLDAGEREALVPRFEPSVLAPGAKAISAGEDAGRLHVVVSGELEVKQDGQVIGTLGPGDVFGEMSLLQRRPATADVVAKGRTVVTLSLPREKFDDIAVKHPELLAEVYKVLVEREAKNRAASQTLEITADDIVV
jgi:CRP-like cAMP-binding protein